MVGSKILYIDFAQEIYFNLIPNPAKDNINLVLNNTVSTGYSYTIFNSIGQVVKHGVTSLAPNTETSIAISELKSGFYLTNVILEDRILQKNFIKQ